MLEVVYAIAILGAGALIELGLSYIAVMVSNKVVDREFASRNSSPGENQ